MASPFFDDLFDVGESLLADVCQQECHTERDKDIRDEEQIITQHLQRFAISEAWHLPPEDPWSR